MLEEDAELMSNTGLEELLADEPPEVSAEMIRINTEARHLALQVALLIPILAGVARHPERVPDAAAARPGGSGIGRDAPGLIAIDTAAASSKLESSRINFI